MPLTLNLFRCPPSRHPPIYPPCKLKPLKIQRSYKPLERGLNKTGICRAELSQEAPFAVAIGACMLSSFLFPDKGGPAGEDEEEEEEESGVVGATDARFAVMSVISFIPYFNWLSWIFSWMDTGKRRYAIYAIVYLAPYIRSNFSLSPDDSWLPIASIALGVIHVQLEASIRSGDIEGLQFFNDALYSITGRKGGLSRDNGQIHTEERTRAHKNLPSSKKHLKDEVQSRGVPRAPHEDPGNARKDDDGHNKRKR